MRPVLIPPLTFFREKDKTYSGLFQPLFWRHIMVKIEVMLVQGSQVILGIRNETQISLFILYSFEQAEDIFKKFGISFSSLEFIYDVFVEKNIPKTSEQKVIEIKQAAAQICCLWLQKYFFAIAEKQPVPIQNFVASGVVSFLIFEDGTDSHALFVVKRKKEDFGLYVFHNKDQGLEVFEECQNLFDPRERILYEEIIENRLFVPKQNDHPLVRVSGMPAQTIAMSYLFFEQETEPLPPISPGTLLN
ncbi:TPA: hypothetical protein DD617_05260 [Candidatus Uhrbacteria bacterium]|nr:hypothetical protein [Candidatus Uhrbacteria bacterium]